MKQSFLKRATSTFLLTAILSLTLSGIWVYNLYQQVYDVNMDVVTTYQTIRAANQSLVSLDEAAIDVRAFLISDDSNIIKKFPETIITAQLNIETLHQLISDNATELQVFNKLQPLVDAKIAYLEKIIFLYRSGNKTAATTLSADRNRVASSRDIYNLITEIKKLEVGQLDEAAPTYLLMKNEADRFFILFGIVNILWLLLAYICMKRYFD